MAPSALVALVVALTGLPAPSAVVAQESRRQSALTDYPDQPVPGIQIEGWFPDSCDHHEPEPTTFVPRWANGLRHNSQFVIRIPFDWTADGRTPATTRATRG